MITEFSIIVGIVLIGILLSPFFIGEGGALESSAAIEDVEKIEATKLAFLRRYLKEEEAAKEGLISQGVWKKRKELLIGRYLDVSRRGDLLKHLHEDKGQK